MRALTIDPEFSSIGPALSPDERAALEDSLKAEGCRDALVVWAGQDVLLDGHNRYAICQEHGIEFRVLEMEFESRNHAIVWIVRNQCGRRNVTQAQKEAMTIQHMKPALKQIGLDKQVEGGINARSNSCDNKVWADSAQTLLASEQQKEPHDTDATLATEAGTSERGIRQTAYILKHAPESLQVKYLDGSMTRDRAYKVTRALLKLPEGDRPRAFEICTDSDEKVRTLIRIQKSSSKPDSNGTYDEILQTGGFHYGDDMEKWCDFSAADMAAIDRALKSVAKYHAKLAAEQRRQERAEIAGAVDGADADATPFMPSVQPGEWWQLGAHRLYCGDTSHREFIDGIGQGAFAFADPPYNAGAAEWDMQFIWAHDWLHDKAPVVAVTPGIASIFEFARHTSMPYAWSMACWIDNGMTRGAVGFGNWIYVALFARKSIYRHAQDFLRVSIKASENDETVHKGRKPSELVARLLELFSKEGETVIDPFLGSGTTLLVAEQMGRVCVGGEINPEYCTEIVARWQDMTGQRAEKVVSKPLEMAA